MDKAKGSSRGRTPACCQSSARKASRASGLSRAQQGDLSEAAFVYEATSLGLVVAKPHGNLHPYDFVVDGGGGLLRIQVKSCANLSRGFYRVRICRRKDGVGIPYTESEIDFLVAYIIPEKTCYILPIREMLGRTSISFRPREFPGMHAFAHHREAWHLLRQPMKSRSDEVDRQAPTIGSICKIPLCDATMYHMRKASVRDLRYDFRKIERLLHQGEQIQITKRRRVIARLVPESEQPAAGVPDFLGRLRATYGEKVLAVSGAALVSEDRKRY
jgi:antitoxin (DNA-binding transcriptional repressor) of toxin-antitoxin stability system